VTERSAPRRILLLVGLASQRSTIFSREPPAQPPDAVTDHHQSAKATTPRDSICLRQPVPAGGSNRRWGRRSVNLKACLTKGLEHDVYESDALHRARALAEMGEQCVADFRLLHPESPRDEDLGYRGMSLAAPTASAQPRVGAAPVGNQQEAASRRCRPPSTASPARRDGLVGIVLIHRQPAEILNGQLSISRSKRFTDSRNVWVCVGGARAGDAAVERGAEPGSCWREHSVGPSWPTGYG
jgi:hypothetical protein